MAVNEIDDPLESRKPFLSLIGVCAVPLIVGLLLIPDRPSEAMGIELGDLSEAQIVEIRRADGVTVLSGEFRTRTDALGNVEKDAALVAPDGRDVIGEVEIDVPRPTASDRGQELEVDIIHLTPRSTFVVVIDDRPVASFGTDDRGSVDIEIEAERRTR